MSSNERPGSLLDRRSQPGDEGRPTVRYREPYSDSLIGIASLAIIAAAVAAAAYLFYVYYRDASSKVTTTDRSGVPPAGAAFVSTSVLDQGVTLQCPSGYCATNIFNGKKRCPIEWESPIIAELPIEVCNPPNGCTDTSTPYAINADGSTNLNGVCETVNGTPTICRCQRYPSCPVYIRSIFNTYAGNPYDPLEQQRVMLRQTSIHTSADGTVTSNGPLTLSDTANQFCVIPHTWVERMVPRECLNGTLAYIIPLGLDGNGYDNFDPDAANVGCVDGSPCPANKLAVWDTRIDRLRCINDRKIYTNYYPSTAPGSPPDLFKVSYRSLSTTSTTGVYNISYPNSFIYASVVIVLAGAVAPVHRPSSLTRVGVGSPIPFVEVDTNGDILIAVSSPIDLATFNITFKVSAI